MTTSRLVQDGTGHFWVVGEDVRSYPVMLSICPACEAVVLNPYSHAQWHDELEASRCAARH